MLVVETHDRHTTSLGRPRHGRFEIGYHDIGLIAANIFADGLHNLFQIPAQAKTFNDGFGKVQSPPRVLHDNAGCLADLNVRAVGVDGVEKIKRFKGGIDNHAMPLAQLLRHGACPRSVPPALAHQAVENGTHGPAQKVSVTKKVCRWTILSVCVTLTNSEVQFTWASVRQRCNAARPAVGSRGLFQFALRSK